MRFLDLLKRLEWNGYNGLDCCPECCGYEVSLPGTPAGHKPNCELKAAIDHFEKVAAVPEELNKVTTMLCEVCGLLEDETGSRGVSVLPDHVAEWWKEHQKFDQKRGEV